MSNRIFFTAAAFALVLGTVAAGTCWAQQAPPEGVPAHLVVTAEPRKGSEVPVINRDDVMVFEGKDRDQVIDWVPAQGDHAALQLFVMLDDGSNSTLGTQIEDIKKFINEQPPSTAVGVAYMQNGIAKVEQNPTTDHALAAKAIRLPMGMRGINGSPYFSLTDLIKRWPETTARREIFMATDGIDRYYGIGDMLDPYLDEAINNAQRAGILVSAIYTPGVGHFGHSYWQAYWGQLYLADLADKTGGEAYYIGFSGPPVSFTPYLEQFSERLGHQYFLVFLAKPPKKPGLQRVRVRTEIQNVDLISAQQVYVAPPAK
ncbi:MAG: hypothetical protein WCF26_27690 [Candidatus Sulfotelmatobacter sp.]